MDANSQTRGGRAAGRPIGAPNYNNNILIEVVERYLPQGLEAWNAADDENVAAVAMVRPRPQSLPAFVGHRVGVSSVGEMSPAFVVCGVGASTSAVLSSASRGGGDSQYNYAEEESDIIH